jgi:hypothetical protein
MAGAAVDGDANAYTPDVWLPSIAQSFMYDGGPLVRLMGELYPPGPVDQTIKWYRRLPDHEIDMELAGEWVEPEEVDLWDDGW